MKNDKLFKQYIQTHNKMIDQNGFTEKSLWGSRESQQKRFKILAGLIKTTSEFSILDLGCGLCDFNQFLLNNNFKNFKYTGLEINLLFVNEVKRRDSNINIIHGSVDKLNLNESWDYVIASGIYNLGDSIAEVESFFLEQFKYLYPKIDKGFAVNFLSSYSQNKDSISLYHEPETILKYCMDNFSSKIVLSHDYLPHDFTIFVFK